MSMSATGGYILTATFVGEGIKSKNREKNRDVTLKRANNGIDCRSMYRYKSNVFLFLLSSIIINTRVYIHIQY